MKGYKTGRDTLKRAAQCAAVLILCAAAVAVIWLYLGSTGEQSDEQGQRLLEDSLWQAVSVCYSIEGVYPPTIDYITRNYGVVIDDSRYAVFYSIFADNILPDITVIPLY